MLLLDSEALSALAHRRPKDRYESMRALLSQARADAHDVVTSAAVLAEVVRGRANDSAVYAALRRERLKVHPVDVPAGVRAGQLMGAARVGSECAVDAFLVAVGDLGGGAVVATVDKSDIERLAEYASRVRVADIR